MLNKFLKSGIIERYCLNDVSVQERKEVEEMSEKYEEIRKEIEIFKRNLSSKEINNSLSKIKTRLLREVYQNVAKNNFSFLPLLDIENNHTNFEKVIQHHNIMPAIEFNGNIKVMPLPSTIQVENAAVWIRAVIDEEIHTRQNEYIYIIKGSCIMYIEGVETAYEAGELIIIPPHVMHSAKITSAEPMFAFVQRQLLAQN